MKIKSVYSSFGGFELSNLVADIKESNGRFFAYNENNELIYELRSKEVVVCYEPGQKKERKPKETDDQFSQEVLDLTSRFIELLTFNNPKVSIPKNLVSWYKEMDKLLRIDNLTYEEVLSIIEYSQVSDFWKSIILSVPKLRTKKDTLLSQSSNYKTTAMKQLQALAGGTNGPTGSGKSDFLTFD